MCWTRNLFAAAVGLVLGCGGGGTASGPATEDPGSAPDVRHDEGGRDLYWPEVILEDVAREEVSLDSTETDTEEPCLGMFGCTCKSNEQCQSGFCVEAPEGKVCTKLCFTGEDCPEDWDCRQVVNAQGDTAWICVPYGLYLCRPCRSNAECSSTIEISENRCVSFGASGSFCGVKCGGEENRPCPAGYTCQDVPIVGGQRSNQCVPDSGICQCNALAILANASTDCYIANEWGTCKGTRQCIETGLTACDAKVPAREECNGKDDDCDGKTDPEGAFGCTVYYQDMDLDGYGMGAGKCLCSDPGPGFSTTPGDCNDVNDGVHPGAVELCNGIDDNCDGVTDEVDAIGCSVYYLDNDGDGYGVVGKGKCLCFPSPPYTGSQKQYDCDDSNADVYPGATEKCDGLDNDCDGITDPENAKGCQPWYYDGDSDGFGSSTKFKCLCGPAGLYNTQKSGDCDDMDPMVHPVAIEICNGKDDNCNGQTDEGDVSVLCPPKPGVDLHGTVACEGVCKVVECNGPTQDEHGNYVPGWYDVNVDFKDGCECQAGPEEGLGGEACQSAINLGLLPDSGVKILVSGNIAPADDEDWYVVDAKDMYWNSEPNGCDLFNVKIVFTKNPGNQFVVDVFRGSCAGASNICSGGLVFEWATNFMLGNIGECACSSASTPLCDSPQSVDQCLQDPNGGPDKCNSCPGYAEKGKNFCTDNSAKFYIRVRREKSKPATCDQYEFEVSNGLYPWSQS